MPILAKRVKARLVTTPEGALTDTECRMAYSNLRRDTLALCDENIYLRTSLDNMRTKYIEAKGASGEHDD